MLKEVVLIIGACGQVGTELTLELRNRLSNAQVVATDVRPAEGIFLEGPYEVLDILDKTKLYDIVTKYQVTQIYNLAALLSATAEKNPNFGWQLNMDGHLNVLNLAKEHKQINKIYWPSSIAVFGPNTPRINTPQHCVMDPNTMYGITKLAGERLSEYYFQKFGVDTRSLRYPGLISYKTEPGGGTTDYAVHIFYEALRNANYTCFLKADTALPMLYMEDAIKATLDIMDAPSDKIKIRSSYNLAGFSFTPDEIAKEITKHIPAFKIDYEPDFRQAIADSWPASIDDTQARKDWNWANDYSFEQMVADMLVNIKQKTTVVG